MKCLVRIQKGREKWRWGYETNRRIGYDARGVAKGLGFFFEAMKVKIVEIR
jgi:hypothetical protein